MKKQDQGSSHYIGALMQQQSLVGIWMGTRVVRPHQQLGDEENSHYIGRQMQKLHTVNHFTVGLFLTFFANRTCRATHKKHPSIQG